MSSKNRNAADAGARFWAEMSARIDAEENAKKKNDLDVVEYAKGLYLKWDYEEQQAKKANPLEVLAEQARERRAEEEAKQKNQAKENNSISKSLVEFFRGDQDGYFRQFRRN